MGGLSRSEFVERSGLAHDTAVQRLTRAGVIRPTYPHGKGSGRPARYSEIDVTAARVWSAACKVLEYGRSIDAARCARGGRRFVLVTGDGALAVDDVVNVVHLVNLHAGALTVIDVTKVIACDLGVPPTTVAA